MPKYCVNGCNRYVFSHGLCIYCYRKQVLYPKQKEKNKQSVRVYNPIKKNSAKRQLLNDEYSRVKKQKWDKLVEMKENRCFFTNVLLDPNIVPDFHHALGRDGDLLTDPDYMFPTLFQPHRDFHDMHHEYDNLEKYDWYFPWLKRMKEKYPIIYFKEMNKIERANGKVPKRI